jgi:L-malate glycosyltransferase
LNPATRILILTPTALPTITGNAMTAERWRRSLSALGFEVEVFPVQDADPVGLVEFLQKFSPHLIHVHHAWRAGSILLHPRLDAVCKKIPLVVSPGGTDVNVDWKLHDRREVICQIFSRARFIVVQSEEFTQRLGKVFPEGRAHLVFLPKSFVWLGNEVFDLRGAANCRQGDVLFFFPAGIRPVKGNLECLQMLEKVYAARPQIRAVFAGAAIDAGYAARFGRAIKRSQYFACWLPPIPPRAIRSGYEAADIVLNASRSEGLSNALIEATAASRPILASKIPGNRWPVLGEDGNHPMGLLYDLNDPKDFLKKALILVDEEEVRKRLGEAGKKRGTFLPTPREEATRLGRVYARALNGI